MITLLIVVAIVLALGWHLLPDTFQPPMRVVWAKVTGLFKK